MSRARRRSWCWQKSSWAKYLHRRKPLGRGADGHVWRSEAVTCGIPYRAAAAKRLRYEPVIYARYGGESGGMPERGQPPRSCAGLTRSSQGRRADGKLGGPPVLNCPRTADTGLLAVKQKGSL